MPAQITGTDAMGRILIVDDEPDFLESVEWQLKKRGYLVFTAGSGDAALDIIRKECIDVLVVDIRMPGMDGIELIRLAASIDADLQSIIMTGHGGIKTAIEAMKLGAINYLQKPAGVEELDFAIRKGIEKRDLIRAVREKQERLEKANLELTHLQDQLKEALGREIELRRQAQGDLHQERLRQSLVEAMCFALRCWKQVTRKTKVDLAEESQIWTASIDVDGTYRTRTMDRYLKIVSLPSNPRVNDVLDTGYFVLSRCSECPDVKKKLEEKIDMLEELIRKAPAP
jgi:YesN/AraC family two-component response regulator